MHEDRPARKLERKQREWARKDKEDRDNAVRALIQHGQGRKYLYWLLDIGKAIGQNPFTANALTTSFACGEQSVGQQIMAHLIEVAPDDFLKMLKETANERNSRSADARDASAGDTAGGPAYAADADT